MKTVAIRKAGWRQVATDKGRKRDYTFTALLAASIGGSSAQLPPFFSGLPASPELSSGFLLGVYSGTIMSEETTDFPNELFGKVTIAGIRVCAS